VNTFQGRHSLIRSRRDPRTRRVLGEILGRVLGEILGRVLGEILGRVLGEILGRVLEEQKYLLLPVTTTSYYC